jgi:hypothetical protein
MEYSEFLEKVNTILGKFAVENDRISVEWVTGGMEGGNCYGDSAEPFTNFDPEPELEYLDQLLTGLCPNLKFLDFKVIKDLVKRDTRGGDHEYYGNETNYEFKYVELKELHQHLLAKGFL